MDKTGNMFTVTLHGGGTSGCDANGYVGCGAVIKLSPTGKENVLYSFCAQANCVDGADPNAALFKIGEALYGTTYYGGVSGDGTAFVVNENTGKETVLHSFAGGTSDGANPHGSLVRKGNGSLFGTTMYGGAYGAGTIFQLTP